MQGPKEVSFKDYLEHPAISRSKLQDLLKSRWHFEADSTVVETDEMRLGTRVHELLLTPGISDCVVAPELNKRTKAGREQWAAFAEENGGKTILTKELEERAQAIVEAYKLNPIALNLIDACEHKEISLFFEQSGFDFKARLDLLSVDNLIIGDVKTTSSADPEEFSRSIYKFGYHMQAAFYIDAVKAALGLEITDYIIAAIETKEPYGTAIYMLDDESIEIGRIAYKKAIAMLDKLATLPRVYPEKLQSIGIPHWAKKREYYND